MVPHYLEVDDHYALKDIDSVIFSQETINFFPAVGPWILYRAMRGAGFRVCFEGAASDGLFGSESPYVLMELEQAISRLDLRRYLELRHVLRGLVVGNSSIDRATIQNFHVDRATLLGELRWLAKYGFKRLPLVYSTYTAVRALQTKLLGIGGRAPLISHTYPPRLSSIDRRTLGMSSLEASIFDTFHNGATRMQLTNLDRASMANGMESRMPFLDWRLVTFVFALPDESRNGDGYTKRVLRIAMQGIVPDPVRLRTRKMAYISPIDYWSRGALKPWLLDLSANRSFAESTVWNGSVARAQVERVVAGQTSIASIWPVLNAYILEQSFKARANFDSTSPFGEGREPSSQAPASVTRGTGRPSQGARV